MQGSKRAIVTLSCLLLSSLAAAPATSGETGGDSAEQAIAAALSGDHRVATESARDIYRHPQATLLFFGLQPGMIVIEMWPGGGWYTAVLAPALGAEGHLIAATYSEAPPDYRPRVYRQFLNRLEANETVYGNVELHLYEPPKRTGLGPAASADMVVTFRNAHNWINHEISDTVFADMYAVLKPGGVLGFVQHRGKEDWDVEDSAPQGYVPESAIIRLAEKAGFTLEARSEVNANPKDAKDYSKGVWSLPPTYRLEDEDREFYTSIGESDRMTLKFVKPND
ncbi:MAG: methyltransferase [Gammaproteobacteria bacterium]